MAEVIILTVAILLMVITGTIVLHNRRQEQLRCPICQGRRIALAPGGRPDESLCERHYRVVWKSVMLAGDAD